MNTEECENVPNLRLLTKSVAKEGEKKCCVNLDKLQKKGKKNGDLSPNPLFANGEILPTTLQSNNDFHELTSVPLVEIDSYYIGQQTFVTIGRNKKIHRFSSYNGFDVLSPFSSLRRTAIFILTDWIFQVLMITTIVTHCLYLFLGFGSLLLPEIEIIFLVVYVFELSIKISAHGIISDQFTYLRIPWNWLDLIIILFFDSIIPIKSLIILKIVPLFPGMKNDLQLFFKMIKNLLKMGAYISIVVIGFAIMAHHLFSNVCMYSNPLESKCYPIENIGKNSSLTFGNDLGTNDSKWFLDYERVNSDYTICGNVSGSRDCPEGYSCVRYCSGGPSNGWTSFHTFPLAFFNVVSLLFQDNAFEIYRSMWNELGPLCTPFFVAVFFAGTFGIGIIVYGTVGATLRLKTRKECADRRVSAQPGETTDIDLTPIITTKQKILHVTEIITFAIIILDISVTVLYTCGSDKYYEYGEPISDTFYAIVCTKICILCYTFEVIVKLICKGPRVYIRNGWDIFNLLIVTFGLMNIAVENHDFFEKGYYNDASGVMLYGRAMLYLYVNVLQLRALKIIPRCATLKVAVKIIMDFFKFFGNWVIFLLMFLFIFSYSTSSLIGSEYLRRFHWYPDEEIPRWNFLDVPHSFMTIFRLLAGEWVETFRNCYKVFGKSCFFFYIPCVLIGQLLIVICAVAVVDTTIHTLADENCFLNAKTEINEAVEWMTSHHIFQLMKQKIDFKCFKGVKFPNNYLSQAKQKWIHSKEIVDKISSVVILLTWVPLIFEYYSEIGFELVFYTDIIFVVYFASELVYRLYLQQFKTCILDSLLILVTVCSLSLGKNSSERLFFVSMKSCRLIMTVTRIENLRAVGYGLAKQLQTTKYFLFSGAFIWLLFAMKAIWEFNLLLYKCIDPLDNTLVPYQIIISREECLANNLTWISESNFDGFKNSFSSLTQVASLNGYSGIAEDASDITFIGCQPSQDNSYQKNLFFIPFFIFGVFFVFNILFGVIFHSITKDEKLELFMTKKQLEHYKIQEKTIKILVPFAYPRPNNHLGIFHDIVSNWRFDFAIMSIILIDVLPLAIFKIEEDEYYSWVLGIVILTIYTAEFIGKLLCWGRSYWLNVWNIFDFFVVVYGIFDLSFGHLLDCQLYSGLVRGGRLARAFQFQPLLRRCRILSRFLTAFTLIKSALFNLLIFLSIVVLIFGAIWSRPNSQDFDPQSPFKNDQPYVNVLLDVFQVLTFSGWNIITQGIVRVDQLNCQGPVLGTPCVHSYPFSYIFLCLVISFWITMNMYLIFIWEFIKQLEFKDAFSSLQVEPEIIDNQQEDNGDNNQEMQSTSANLSPPSQCIE